MTVRFPKQNSLRQAAWTATVALLLGACASTPPAPVVDLSERGSSVAHESGTRDGNRETAAGAYRVVRGDTLYAIAFRHGLDYRDIAAWNGIEPPYRIYAGQELRLQRPSHASAAAAAPVARDRLPPPPPPSRTAAAPSAATATQPGMFEDVQEKPPAAAEESRAAASREGSPQAQPSTTATSAAAPVSSAAPPSPREAPPAPVGAAASGAAPPPAAASVVNAGGVSWRWPGRGALVGTFAAGDPTRQGIDIAGSAGDPVVAAADGEVVYSGNGLLGYGELIIVKHNANYLSAYGHNRKRLVQEGEHVKAGQQIAEMGSSASSRDELHFEIRKNGKPVNPLDYLPAR